MKVAERLSLPLLRAFDPETAHGLALKALQLGLASGSGPVESPRLRTSVAGLELPNPIGLAAGFDKNAEAVAPLLRAGFGFLEVGAAPPRPQEGNPRPRLYRLSEDRAASNRFGFNNQGSDPIAARLAKRPKGIPVGINLGANKDSPDRAADFASVLTTIGPHVDFATVNVSSPNTEKLRDLQGASALSALLSGVLSARDALPNRVAIFLKVAPDLEDGDIADIAEVALTTGIDGIIATNTTLSRDGLRSPHARETGGLSGAPLFERSTRVLARMYRETEGKLPLIGVGGGASAEDALAKVKAGATAVQLYTGLVYGGLSLATEIAEGLDAILRRDGLTIKEAVGLEADRWL